MNKKVVIIVSAIIGILVLLAMSVLIFIKIILAPKEVINYNLIEVNYETSALNYISDNKLYNLNYNSKNYIVLKDLKSYYTKNELDDKRRDVGLSCRGYVFLSKSTGNSPNVDAYISCGEKFNPVYETKNYNDLYQYDSSINKVDETDSEAFDSCESIKNNTLDSKIVAEYKFESTVKTNCDIDGECDVPFIIDLYLYENNIMKIHAVNSPQASGEFTFGTYKNENNQIVITRKYTANDDWNCASYNYIKDNDVDVFTINTSGDLETNKYNGAEGRYTMPNSVMTETPIVLKKIK